MSRSRWKYSSGSFSNATSLIGRKLSSPIGLKSENRFENASKPLDEKENQGLVDFLNKVGFLCSDWLSRIERLNGHIANMTGGDHQPIRISWKPVPRINWHLHGFRFQIVILDISGKISPKISVMKKSITVRFCSLRCVNTIHSGHIAWMKSLKSLQDDWNAPDYMNWEHEKPRNGPFVGLAKVSIDLTDLETCRRSWKHKLRVDIKVQRLRLKIIKIRY